MNMPINPEIFLEIALSFFYLVPISLFRYIPFKDKFRFSTKITVILYFSFFIFVNTLLALFGKYNTFTDSNRFRVLLYFFMTLFSFFLVKDSIRKQFYVICFYANYSLLFSATSLIAEVIIFNKNSINLHFKVISMIIVLLIAMPIIYRFSFKPMKSILQRQIPKIWDYLWLAGFIQLGLNSALSIPYQVDNIQMTRNALIRLSISLGSILLNQITLYLISNMLEAHDKNIAMSAEKQQYMIQEYQYRHIQEQVENSRRFRHDFKHHAAMISSIVENANLSDSEKLNKLSTYCKEYFGSIPQAEEQHFCDHYLLNLLLNYYYERSLENNYSFIAKINIPVNISIPDTELCVLVGNLLLNADEAVKGAPSNLKQVVINITKSNNNLLILVENGFDGQLNISNDIFHSTKHEGDGIGIQSVQNITAKYNGSSYFEHNEKVFSAKIHLYLKY